MAAGKSTRRWLRRHVHDPYVQEANARGYRSRAAFKLIQLDAAEQLFRGASTVIDLGAAPGGWSQVAAQRVGARGRVVAVDLLPMQPLAGVALVQGDFLQEPVRRRITDLSAAAVDLVLSDMAPNLTGIKERDQALMLEIGLAAQDFAAASLKSGGVLVVKVFQGGSLAELRAQMRENYQPVKLRKPPASRGQSTENYLIAYRR